jgi:hypothetical protein
MQARPPPVIRQSARLRSSNYFCYIFLICVFGELLIAYNVINQAFDLKAKKALRFGDALAFVQERSLRYPSEDLEPLQ